MKILHGYQLVSEIRKYADRVTNRLWIAVPYIGSDKTITSVLGVRWFENPQISIRLLTDASDFNRFNISSIKLFAQRGEIKDLLGLHAKIYIIDDCCFITSANLTRTAFSQRYEIGLMLKGNAARDTEKVFNKWWGIADRIETIKINRVMSSKDQQDSIEDKQGLKLPKLNELPKAQYITIGSIKKKFLDYPRVLEEYQSFAVIYKSIQRIYKKYPLYLEIDTFLNYLYHEAPRRPSNAYKNKSARYLSPKAQRIAIKKYAKNFKKFIIENPDFTHIKEQRNSHKIVSSILEQNKIDSLTKKDLLAVFDRINGLNSYPINKTKILNNNTLQKIRNNLFNLLFGDEQLPARMNRCSEINYMGTSTINEIVGYFDPYNYPIMNKNSNSGLRFFGFNIPKYR